MVFSLLLLVKFIRSTEALLKGQHSPFTHSSSYVEIPETSIIFKQLGIVLQEDQFMGLDTNNRMISVFLKLNKPSTAATQFQRCNNSNHTYYESMAINKTISEYITIFEQIVKLSAGHYNPDVSNTSKSVHKRSILGFFNLGLNIMTSAISGINQYRLSKHFNDLRADFVKFAEQVNLMNKNNVLIHKKFVKILKTLNLV